MGFTKSTQILIQAFRSTGLSKIMYWIPRLRLSYADLCADKWNLGIEEARLEGYKESASVN